MEIFSIFFFMDRLGWTDYPRLTQITMLVSNVSFRHHMSLFEFVGVLDVEHGVFQAAR